MAEGHGGTKSIYQDGKRVTKETLTAAIIKVLIALALVGGGFYLLFNG